MFTVQVAAYMVLVSSHLHFPFTCNLQLTVFCIALEGKAPRILAKCTKSGVPFYSVAVVLAIALLSFLQVSNNAAVVLQWFVNLVCLPLSILDLATPNAFTGNRFSINQLLGHKLHFHQV